MSKKSPKINKAVVDASFAEQTLLPGYRDALNNSFELDPTEYASHQEVADAILYDTTMRFGLKNPEHAAWEARRLAATLRLGGASIGAFVEYFDAMGGKSNPTDTTRQETPLGRPEVVRTNSKIITLNKMPGDPIDFIENALLVIDNAGSSIGPENYATTLKYFADKYRADDSSEHLDKNMIRSLVERCLSGFGTVSESEEPNYIEMTNIYSAILDLPKGSVGGQFTKMLLSHSLRQLPSFDKSALKKLVACISKLDVSNDGEVVATLVDLALRKNAPIETTRVYSSTLQTIANLPRSSAANRTFATFLEVRSKLERPLDIWGLDSVNILLLKIVNDVIDDPELTIRAKEIALANAVSANEFARKMRERDDISEALLVELELTRRRIIQNYVNI